jgi:hypothetical protein
MQNPLLSSPHQVLSKKFVQVRALGSSYCKEKLMFSKRDAAQKLVAAALLATVKTCQMVIQMRKLASYRCQRALPPSTRNEYHQLGSLCNFQNSSLTPAD